MTFNMPNIYKREAGEGKTSPKKIRGMLYNVHVVEETGATFVIMLDVCVCYHWAFSLALPFVLNQRQINNFAHHGTYDL